MSKKNICVIGASGGIAAPNPECGDGPIVLEKSGILNSLNSEHIALIWEQIILPGVGGEALPTTARYCQQLAQVAEKIIQRGDKVLTIGGDHSCAIGTFSGVSQAIGSDQTLGLVWVDAHLDAHLPETTPSGNIHGMPLAVLLGQGYPELTTLCHARPKVLPEHVALVGVRSFEQGEQLLLQNLGVSIYYMQDIDQQGLDKVLQRAFARASKADHVAMTIDLDAFNPEQVPGVGCREPNGVHLKGFCQAMTKLKQQYELIAAEIVEYDPSRDVEKKTQQAILELARSLF